MFDPNLVPYERKEGQFMGATIISSGEHLMVYMIYIQSVHIHYIKREGERRGREREREKEGGRKIERQGEGVYIVHTVILFIVSYLSILCEGLCTTMG